MAQRTEYDMTPAESALLMAATKDAMAAAGTLGGSLSNEVGSAFATRGGAAGGRFGARFTRPHSAATVVELSRDAQAVREQARTQIADTGVEIDDPNAAGDGSVWGVVGSGVWNMAPALVRVDVEPTAAGGCRVRVRATGREGLIKQQIAAKAVDRIRDAVARHAP
ncbi:MAG: hypothetical protein LC790_13105 [Actinobacteria bacterium]|nr:hypothetical protein [Actinomycetota bacterium]